MISRHQILVEQLREFANFAKFNASWLEPAARHPNDDDDPEHRTVTLDALLLDDFLTDLRCLGPMLEELATQIEAGNPEPHLQQLVAA